MTSEGFSPPSRYRAQGDQRVALQANQRYLRRFLGRQTEWFYPTLLNGWNNYGDPWELCSFRRLPDGRVEVRGLVRDGTYASGSTGVIFVLPSGFRPDNGHIFLTRTNLGTNRISIDSAGNVIAHSDGSGGSWLSLAGIVFTPDDR